MIGRPKSRKHCRSPKCADYLSRSSLPGAAAFSARSRPRTYISPGKFAFPIAVLQQLLLAPLQHSPLRAIFTFGSARDQLYPRALRAPRAPRSYVSPSFSARLPRPPFLLPNLLIAADYSESRSSEILEFRGLHR